MGKKLHGKWALVTGSSRGIGQQLALGLAGEDANVIVHARTMENTKKTMDLLEKFDVAHFCCGGGLGICGGD